MAGVISTLLTKTDEITRDFIFHGYQALASHYQPMIISLVVIAIALVGWGVVSGWLTLSIAELSKRALIIGFVLALALHWGTFSEYIYKVFTQAPNEIAGHLVSALNGHDITSGVEAILHDGLEIAANTWRAGGMSNVLPCLYSVAIILMTLFICGLGLAELIAAKFGMAILLVLAPIIIPLYLFKATKEALFDGWLKHLITFAFVPVFIAATLALVILLMKDTIGDIKHITDAREAIDMGILLPYIIGAFVSIQLLWRTSQLAASMAGGISASITQGMGGMIASKMMHASNNTKATDTKASSQNSHPPAQPSNQTPPPKRT